MLPANNFISVLSVRHDVIKAVDELLQISHLVGLVSIVGKGLSILPY